MYQFWKGKIEQLEAENERLRAVVRWTFVLNPDFDDTGVIGHNLEPIPDEIRRTIIETCQAATAAGGN